ncbi:MAG TPA: thiamine-phosphate kinase [Bdellovibrionota bacterium]|nr:thiamine-phosphate kinase [Bdellovibrionota bacterium]
MIQRSGEFVIIDDLARIFGRPAYGLGIGDDAAVFSPRGGMDLVWTTDVQVDGFHFHWDWISPEPLGRRAAAVSLSDLAAMGARPLGALVSFHLPPSIDRLKILSVARGIQERVRDAGAHILGGNLTGDKTFSVEISFIGEVPSGRALLRSTAREGDHVYVTGVPGSAALALLLFQKGFQRENLAKEIIDRWRNPLPRLVLGQKLIGLASAAIDISDGFLADGAHLAAQSHVDLEIDESALPESDSLVEIAQKLGTSFSQVRFEPSDDYELLFTAPASAHSEILELSSEPIHRIGRVLKGNGQVWLLGRDGTKDTVLPLGWDHLAQYQT